MNRNEMFDKNYDKKMKQYLASIGPEAIEELNNKDPKRISDLYVAQERIVDIVSKDVNEFYKRRN